MKTIKDQHCEIQLASQNCEEIAMGLSRKNMPMAEENFRELEKESDRLKKALVDYAVHYKT